MQRKICSLILTAATVIGASASAAIVECKVTGVNTWVTAEGHQEEGPKLREQKTENEVTKTRVFTNVVAEHTMVDGRLHLVTSGESDSSVVTLDVMAEANDPARMDGQYSETFSPNHHITLPVQCSARE